MFDLITGKTTHIPHAPAAPIMVSMAAQLTAMGLLIALPLLYVTDQLPAPSMMIAFVAAAPAPPPPLPPPPPPPPPPAEPRRARLEKPVPTTGTAAPGETPLAIAPEPPMVGGDEESVVGGVEGGIPGGIVSGIVGGIDIVPPPPPPPPPPAPAPRTVVRAGGEIKAPALLHRVEPVYPPFARAADIEGMVILEAIVDEAGQVTDVKVLRSAGVLDRAAIEAVHQWRYEPLLLNGRPTRFLLTVVLTFSLKI